MGTDALTLAVASLSVFGAFIGAIVAGAAVYGGIRADLRHLHESINRAHDRIDALTH